MELGGTQKLCVSLDRTMLKAPARQGQPGGDLLHWDFDVRAEHCRFKFFQATLFLEDCAEDQVRSPKLTVGFSQSSCTLMTYRVVGAGYLSVRSRISNEVRAVAETGERSTGGGDHVEQPRAAHSRI